MYKENFKNHFFQKAKFNQYIQKLFKPSEQKKITKTLNFATKKHKGQFHFNRSPYIIHPIRVALILIEELKLKNPKLICAALLHDIIEDCSVVFEDLNILFGYEVANLVKKVTRVRPVNETEKQKTKNKILKIQEIAKTDKKARLLKLCDVLDNARSEIFIPRNSPFIKKIPRWHKEFLCYLPIAQYTHKVLFKLFVRVRDSWYTIQEMIGEQKNFQS